MASIRSDSERVAQAGEGLRLALGPCAPFAVSSKRGWEDHDGHGAIEARVAGLVDFAYTARTDRGLDLVGPEGEAAP